MRKIFYSLKKFILLIIVISIIDVVFLSTLTIIRPLVKIAFGILTIALTLFISFFTTIKYKKLNQELFLKRIVVSKHKKISIKAKAFLEILFYGVVFITVWLMYVYLFNLKGWGSEWRRQTGELIFIDWSKFSFHMYFYYSFMEVIMIIIFFYLLNHFIKEQTLVFLIVIATVFYLLVFSCIFYHPLKLERQTIDNEFYFSWNKNIGKTRIIINTLLFPWSALELFGKDLFYVGSSWVKPPEPVPPVIVNWFDMSHMNDLYHTDHGIFFKTITWNPFVISFLPFFLVSLKNLFFPRESVGK